MAKSKNRLLIGLPTKLVVDEDTGTAELYTIDSTGDTLVASGNTSDSSWDLKPQFRKKYNQANDRNVNQREFEKTFEEECKLDINKDRAEIINDNSSILVKGKLSKILEYVEDPSTGKVKSDTTSVASKASAGQIENNGVDGSIASNDGNLSTSILTNMKIESGNDGGFVIEDGGESFGGAPSLEYPLGMRNYGPNQPDRLFIKILNYEPRGLPTIGNTNGVQAEDSATAETVATIILPIPQGAQDGNIVGWGKQDMNAAEAALGEFALSGMTGGFEGAKAAAENILSDVDAVGGNAKKAIAGILAGNAINKGSQVLTRTSGAIINPNTELLFDGPSLRTFSFQYKLSPREPDEARRIFDIIKVLKKGMAVRKSAQTLFLLTPRIFKLEYKDGTNGTTHKYLNRFKDCALTQLTVNYAPNQTYMAYNDDTGSVPVAFDVSMLFQELSPIFSDDYTQNEVIGF